MIENVKLLIELFVSLYCMAELFGKKLQLNIYVVVLAIMDMFLVSVIDDYGFPKYFISILYVCIFLYALSYYREGVKRTLINFFLTAVIMTTIQLIEFLPLYHLFFYKYKNVALNELFINILCFITIMLLSYKFKFKKISDFFEKRNKLIIGVSIFVLVIIGINFYEMKFTGNIASEAYVQFMLFFLIFAFIIYEWQQSRMDAEKKKTQLEMNGLYYDAYDQLIMLVRERQHDMKSHINTILSIIYTTDNYDELVDKQTEYCNQVMKRNDKTRLVLAVENPLIAGFLYSKIQEAEEKGIKVDYKININKTTLIIPEYELVEMAGILIDNAIEALGSSENVSDREHTKKIYVSMKETENELELTVANTSNYFEENAAESFFETGYSSKGKGRGIGLSKLKRMTNERNGEIIVSNENYSGANYLQFCIIIPVKGKSKGAIVDKK